MEHHGFTRRVVRLIPHLDDMVSRLGKTDHGDGRDPGTAPLLQKTDRVVEDTPHVLLRVGMLESGTEETNHRSFDVGNFYHRVDDAVRSYQGHRPGRAPRAENEFDRLAHDLVRSGRR